MNAHYVAVLIMCASISTRMIWSTNAQKIHYATRLSNFTATSTTNSLYIINMTIYQHKMEHRVATTFNVTRDIHLRNVEIVFRRCVQEKSACEYFQNWTFPGNIVKKIVYMKNQSWSPVFAHVTPKFSTLPLLKADVYTVPDMTIDGHAAAIYYPDVTKYLWIADIVLNEVRKTIAGMFTMIGTINTFVDRNRKS